VTQFKKTYNFKQHFSQDFQKKYSQATLSFIKSIHEPIISIEHFVDIVYLIRNNNETGVGINFEKKACRPRHNVVKNSSLPGGTWPWSF